MQRSRSPESGAAGAPGSRITGRDREAADIARTLHSGRSVIVFGGVGFGKTFLAEAVSSKLRTHDIAPIIIRGTSVASATPFAALRRSAGTQLLGLLDSGTPDVADVAARLTSQGTQPPVLQVDDAHLLDPETTELLYHLAVDGSVALFLAAAPSVRYGTPDSTDITGRLLTSLWIEGHAERMDLEPLSSDEANDLITQIAGPILLDLVTRTGIRVMSGGSPLLIRELTAEGIRGGTLLEEADTLSPSVSPPGRRILDLLTHELSSLAQEEIHGLAILGRLDGLSSLHSAEIFGQISLRTLLQRGLIRRTEGGDDAMRAHRLFAQAAFAISDPDDLYPVRERVVEMLLIDSLRGRELTPVECVLIAEAWSGIHDLGPVIHKWGRTTVASVLVSAGRRCERSGIVDALRFSSWRAWEIAPSTETGIEYSRALAADKRLGQAVTALAAAEDLMQTPTEAVQLLRWWASLAQECP